MDRKCRYAIRRLTHFRGRLRVFCASFQIFEDCPNVLRNKPTAHKRSLVKEKRDDDHSTEPCQRASLLHDPRPDGTGRFGLIINREVVVKGFSRVVKVRLRLTLDEVSFAPETDRSVRTVYQTTLRTLYSAHTFNLRVGKTRWDGIRGG